MQTVHKFRLSPGNPVTVEMPNLAHIIHVGTQDDGPVLWAWVDTDQPMTQREYYVFGTGHPMPSEPQLHHIGTCQTESGFVWHVFRPADGLGQEVSKWMGMMAGPKR